MVSIIIPWNKGIEYLEECLTSIKKQKYSDVETIIVWDKDGKDEDLSTIKSEIYGDINLKIYEMVDKSGVAAARNLGLQKSEGDYIYFLDSDDYLLEDTIEKVVSAISDDKDLAYGRIMHTWFKPSAFNVEQGDQKDTDSSREEAAKIEEFNYGEFSDIKIHGIKIHNRIEDITVLGVLYSKDFLQRNKILFDETQLYYCDVTFWASVMKHVTKYGYDASSIYVKRYHNDKIKHPSLSQIEDNARCEYFATAYINAIKQSDRKFSLHIQKMACDYYVNVFGKKFHNNKESAKREFESISAIIENCSDEVLKKYKFNDKRILKASIVKDMEKVAYWSKIKMIKKKVFTMFSSRKHLYRTINLYIFQKLKVKNNWIIFESFVGRNYAGQPKYIYKYLQENYKDKYKYIWIVDKKGMKIEGKHTKVKRFGLMYYYYMTRSKYWVNNMRQPVWYPKRKDQIMLSTWHGTPLKKLVFDMDDVHSANPHYKEIVYKQTRDWDYLLSDNPFSTEKFQSCFRFDKDKILEYGYPANDPMYYENRNEIAEKVKEALGIPQNKKVILYAPTWRDDKYYEAGHYKFEMALDIDRLKQEVGEEYVILLRMHYWVVDQLDKSGFGDFVYDASSYDDITELYLIADICMTDYSSVFFDFANTKRPILFFTYDLEKYRDVLRGFYLDVEKELPGPLLLTNDDVVYAIKNIDEVNEKYKEKYTEFYNRFCCKDDGHAAERVVEKVFRNV